MNLQELLDYVAVDQLDDRTDLISGDPDELWSNRVIVGFLNEGQRRLSRRAWSIIDIGHAQAGKITLILGQDTYNLHKSVLRVYSAIPTDTAIPLGRTTYNALTYRNSEDSDYFDANQAFTNTAGRPGAFATDAGTRKLKLNRAPDATSVGLVLDLKVARQPVTMLTLDDLTASPEVPEEYHQWIGDYAAGRCLTLSKCDSDMKADGRRILADFEARIKEARQDRQRAEAAPGQFCFASTTAYV